MKRWYRFLAAVLVLSLLFCGCSGGRVRAVEKIIPESELYSKSEIESAMSVVTRTFRSGFDGCTMLEIAYDEEKTLKEMERNAENGETGDVMILVSSFKVGEKSDGSLSPNTTYDGWSWELTRSGLGGWKLTNYGYG